MQQIDTEAIALEEFFAPVTAEQDWQNAVDRQIVQRFRELRSHIVL